MVSWGYLRTNIDQDSRPISPGIGLGLLFRMGEGTPSHGLERTSASPDAIVLRFLGYASTTRFRTPSRKSKGEKLGLDSKMLEHKNLIA